MIRKTVLLILTGMFFSSAQVLNDPIEKEITDLILKSQQEELIFLERLVNINSGTSNVKGITENGELIKTELETLGFDTRWHNLPLDMHHAGSLVATLKGNSGKRILLIGHLDTVFSPDSSFQKFTLSADKKQVTGPGVIDCKGGITTILFALKALYRAHVLKNVNITIVLTGDEELAAKPISISRQALMTAAKNNDIALGFEFALSSNEVIVGRRGLSEWFLTSTGKSQHSSTIFQSNTGFGAVYEIARILSEIQQKLSNTPGLSINPGLLLGGQKVNEDIEKGIGMAYGQKTIIPSIASAHGDLRFLYDQQKNEAEKILNEITSHPLQGTKSNIIFKPIMPPMTATKANYELLNQYSIISKKLGGSSLHPAPPELRGGADISYIASYIEAGLDGLGPWGSGAHTEMETLEIDVLPIVTQRAALFILNYVKTPK